MYYEVSVKFDKTHETGLIKKVTEKYLVEAVSFTEAEARMSAYIAPYACGEYDICAIRRLQVAELFESKDTAADRWYKTKLAYITIDERTAKEKRTMQDVMVKATNFDDARNTIQEGMKGTLGDWEKVQLNETSIIDLVK